MTSITLRPSCASYIMSLKSYDRRDEIRRFEVQDDRIAGRLGACDGADGIDGVFSDTARGDGVSFLAFFSRHRRPNLPAVPDYDRSCLVAVNAIVLDPCRSGLELRVASAAFRRHFEITQSDGVIASTLYTRPWLRELLDFGARGMLEHLPADFAIVFAERFQDARNRRQRQAAS